MHSSTYLNFRKFQENKYGRKKRPNFTDGLKYVELLFAQIVLHQDGEECPPPDAMADKVISYLEAKGYLQA